MSRINEFTDELLTIYFIGMMTHYHKYKEKHKNCSSDDLYHELFKKTFHLVNYGDLNHLHKKEKPKVYKAFFTLFGSLPEVKIDRLKDKDKFNESINIQHTTIINIKQEVYKNYQDPYLKCYHFNDLLISWALLQSFSNHGHHHINMGTGGGLGTGWFNAQQSDEAKKALAGLVLLLIIGALLFLAAVAVYYMLNKFLDGMERIWYNEGWLDALIVCGSAVGFGALSAFFGTFIGGLPLFALAVTAGFPPTAVVILGVTLMTLIGAGLGVLTMSYLVPYLQGKGASGSMDANDANRFRLTASEETHLKSKEMDPVSVKLAILAVLEQMNKISNNKAISVPYFLHRKLGAGRDIQDLLNKVRALRSGALTEIEIGGVTFDLMMKNSFAYTYPAARTLSAPPEDDELNYVDENNNTVYN
jgi:hypothetical protein